MMLGTMVMPRGTAALLAGLVMHFMAGAVFFVVYALLFDAFGLTSGIAGWAALFGAVHGVLAGMMLGMMPLMHPRLATADGIPTPGMFGLQISSMAPIAIIVMHAVFGAVGGAIYQA
jgi:hypothetical protein